MVVRFSMGVLLGLMVCLAAGGAWAQSDDEDTINLYTPRPKEEEVKAKTQRIGILRTQLDESALKKTNPALLSQVEKVLNKAMSMINTRDVQVLSPDEIENGLAPKFKRELAGCQDNMDCMITALQPASLDIFLSSRLSYFDGDYKLTVRWINSKSRKEQVQYEAIVTNPSVLAKKAGILTVRTLIGHGMYVRVQEGEAMETTADDADAKPVEEKQPEPDSSRTVGEDTKLAMAVFQMDHVGRRAGFPRRRGGHERDGGPGGSGREERHKPVAVGQRKRRLQAIRNHGL